jgi:hypothetical protein
MLKADFHMHSKEDWYDAFQIRYSAKELIDSAARQKFEVLAITHHNHVYFNSDLKRYARKKGILLIPGAEVTLEGKHVVILNTTNREIAKLKKIRDLKRLHDHALVIAPHPYFSMFLSSCLAGKLEEYKDCFHAIEYSHFYMWPMLYPPLKQLFNGNVNAKLAAEKYFKPMVGTSDCHRLYDVGKTYSLVDSEKTIGGIISAVKKGKVQVHTRPMPMHLFFRKGISATLKEKFLKITNGGIREMRDVSDEPYFKRFK